MTQTWHGAMRTAPEAGRRTLDDIADRYARDGYVIMPGAFTPAEVAELRAEALRICRGEVGAVAGMEPGPPDEPDEAVIRRYACIHFPHKLSPLMRQALAHPVVVAALTRVIGPGSGAGRRRVRGPVQRLPAAPLASQHGAQRTAEGAGQPLHERAVTAAVDSPAGQLHVAKWDCRDIVMVAGQDPYAWRGITDTSGLTSGRTGTAAAGNPEPWAGQK